MLLQIIIKINYYYKKKEHKSQSRDLIWLINSNMRSLNFVKNDNDSAMLVHYEINHNYKYNLSYP